MEERIYLVEARDHHGAMQRAYCDTYAEANEAAEIFCRGYEFVEIMAGHPGAWETIEQTW